MIPFDFSHLKQEDISLRYHKYGYHDRKNPDFRFEMAFPKDWMMIKVKDPAKLPEESIPIEIVAFHRIQS